MPRSSAIGFVAVAAALTASTTRATPASAQDSTALPVPASEVSLRKPIFQDQRFTAYLLHIPPKEATQMHRHDTDIFTVFVSDGKTTSTFSGQPPTTDSVRAGDVKIRYAGFTHSTRNVASIPFRAVILEFTQPQGTARKDTRPPVRRCDGQSCTRLEHISCTDTYCADKARVDPGSSLLLPAGSAAAVIAVSDYEFTDGTTPGGHARLNGGIEYITSSLPQKWTNKASIPAHVVVVAFH